MSSCQLEKVRKLIELKFWIASSTSLRTADTSMDKYPRQLDLSQLQQILTSVALVTNLSRSLPPPAGSLTCHITPDSLLLSSPQLSSSRL